MSMECRYCKLYLKVLGACSVKTIKPDLTQLKTQEAGPLQECWMQICDLWSCLSAGGAH